MTAATNKVEAFNGFSDWVRFGQRGTVAANNPVEQEKDVKFTSLLANLVIFHNTLDIADVVRELQAEAFVRGRGTRAARIQRRSVHGPSCGRMRSRAMSS
ncbi:transposase (plasmid) [Streptomyces sp. NBC_01591]|nr:Tn3 family transposase [Streptomyces sp. NBC_01591]WSD74749.1 transposase [Streptomyces sp. NBC_01591]